MSSMCLMTIREINSRRTHGRHFFNSNSLGNIDHTKSSLQYENTRYIVYFEKA